MGHNEIVWGRQGDLDGPAFWRWDSQLYHVINAPLTIANMITAAVSGTWVGHSVSAGFITDKVVYLLLVGLLWYWIVGEVQVRGRPTSKRRVRRAVAILVTCLGAVMIGLSILFAFGESDMPYRALRVMGFLIWGLFFILSLGRRLWKDYGPGMIST